MYFFRRLKRNHSPDIKGYIARNNSEHRFSNNYDAIPSPGLALPGAVSIVHSTAGNDLAATSKGTLCNRDWNNYITLDSENPPDNESSSNVYHVAEGQDPYNVTDPEKAKRGDIFKKSKEVETSIDYYAADFKSEMVRNDQINYYAEMTGQSNTEDYVNLGIDDDDKDIPFDDDHNPYHILDPHDPYTARAFLQIEKQFLERNVGSPTPEIDKEVSTPDDDVNPYHILEPLDANTISDTKHSHEQMPGVNVESSADDNDYNKISFKTNTVRNDRVQTKLFDDVADYSHLYGKSVSFLDDTGEYSHLGNDNTSGTKLMRDPDNEYSHIDLQQENRPRVL